jgi:hypothetical protein
MTYAPKPSTPPSGNVVLWAILLLVLIWYIYLVATGKITVITDDQILAVLHSWPGRLVTVAFGCAAGRIFAFQRDFEGSRAWLRQMFPGRSPIFYRRVDFIVSCVLGTVLGMLAVQPDTPQTALATGIGWPVIIRHLEPGQPTNEPR